MPINEAADHLDELAEQYGGNAATKRGAVYETGVAEGLALAADILRSTASAGTAPVPEWATHLLTGPDIRGGPTEPVRRISASGDAYSRIDRGPDTRVALVPNRWLTQRADRELDAGISDDLRRRVAAFLQAPRPGRAGRDDLFYALLAEAYVSIAERSRKATRDLAEECHLGVPRTRDLILEARRRDLLTRPGRGLAGGWLTPKAQAILRRYREEKPTP